MNKKTIEEMGFDELRLETAKRDKAVARAVFKHTQAKARLNQICHHPELHTTSSYVPGGYLNTAYTEYIESCRVCGKVMKRHCVDHGTYG